MIGYRCTGKSSVGKSLADRLDLSFADSDSEVVREQGISISEMVSKHGWDFFREKEREAIKRLSAADKHVIATGGGVVLNPENVKDMKENGIVVWLKATPETIKQRILQDENTADLRPSLTSKGFVEEIQEILSERTPLYENTMDFYIDTDHVGLNEICSFIISKLQQKS
ncbi:Shikimate kinase [Desulfonema magnum]|uniref:Shikimate kinase n=1 Tax=Desulfonema magnum TaxID=45655 RepID=A0A975GNQ1_9BACT|nr:Shikimate kinase [Desulfonema magnum]